MGIQLKAMPHNGEPSQLVGFNNSGGIYCGFVLPRSGLLEPLALERDRENDAIFSFCAITINLT
jgi:hypothetical protein